MVQPTAIKAMAIVTQLFEDKNLASLVSLATVAVGSAGVRDNVLNGIKEFPFLEACDVSGQTGGRVRDAVGWPPTEELGSIYTPGHAFAHD